jgi:hypothetical protein
MAAISTATPIQINGSITASTDTEATITATEMLVGSVYYTFVIPKTFTVATTDYSTTALSPSEEAVAVKLATGTTLQSNLTQIEKLASTSLAQKLA